MTAATTTSGRGGGRLWIGLLIAAVVLTVVLTPGSDDDDPRYHLDSAEPEGYLGLRLLLEETGTDVDRVDADDVDATTVADHDVVFVPEAADGSSAQVSRWRAYVEAGGTLVLGEPGAAIGPRASRSIPSFAGGSSTTRRTCTLERLIDLGEIDLPLLLEDGVAVGGDQSCYGDGTDAVVVRRALGSGEVITLASPDLFTNQVMGAPEPEQKVEEVPDNAVVAQRLLGGARLAVVTSGLDPAVDDGEKTLLDFISPGVQLGLLELCAAAAWYAVARGRRHGRVVTEAVPVTIAGSAFVEAVGSLLERQGDHGRAAGVLRRAGTRELALRLGLPPTIPDRDLAVVLAERTGRPAEEILRLLTDPIDTDTALVDTARALDSLRQEALHV